MALSDADAGLVSVGDNTAQLLIPSGDALDMILKVTSHEKAKVEFDTSKPTTIPFRMVDTSKAKKVLGFEPQVSLEEGLCDTVEWYKNVGSKISY